MALIALTAPHSLVSDISARLRSRDIALLAMLGGVLMGLGPLLPSSTLAFSIATTGAALLALSLLAAGLVATRHLLRQRDLALIARLHAESADPRLLGTSDGQVLWANASAKTALPDIESDGLIALFADQKADPAGAVRAICDQARAKGHAQVQTTTGRCIRVEAVTPAVFFWSVNDTAHESDAPRAPAPWLKYDAEGRLAQTSPDLATADAPQTLSAVFSDAPVLAGHRSSVQINAQRHFALALPDPAGGTGVALLAPRASDAPDQAAASDMHADLQTLPIGIAHIAADGQLCYVNPEARRLLRLHGADLPVISEILEGLGRPVAEWLSDIVTGRMTSATEVLRLNRPESERFLKVTLAQPDPGAGQSDHVVAVLNDATEFKSLEAKFTQSQKMQAIGLLAGGVAHDFNNLLTAITGHCDLLLLRHDYSDVDYPDLIQIQQNTNRAAALVRQLLALSRQQKLEIVTLDLTETMGDLIHLLNRLVGEKVTLTLHHGTDVSPIRSDRRQLEQVLMNLVVNARDAMPLGGEIRIITDTCALPDGLPREEIHLPPGRYTRIRVQDDGVGMSAATRAKVFDPFFTTKRPGEGTGLGLSTVYGIVKQSGGYVFVDSEEGEGTTFSLYFAAQDTITPTARPAPSRLQPNPMQDRPALVLLVEDEAPVRSFAARALELQGHRVLQAESGEAALDILSDPDVRPDCFVSDVVMPGLDGPGWVSQVRDRFPDTPVLFMSGYAEDSRVAAQSRIGNAGFLGKPFSLAEFTSTVNARLASDEMA